MRDTIIIRETFSSRDEAEEARERLEYADFARNSMHLMRVGEQFELAIHTHPGNRKRVQDCINGSSVSAARRYGERARSAAPSGGQSMLLLGVIAAAGAALYYGFTYRRDLRAQRYPSGERSAVRRLYQAHGGASNQRQRAGKSRQDCDLPENSTENLDRKLDHALEETFPTSDPVSVSITR